MDNAFSGHCCACSRACWHVSPPTLCEKHGFKPLPGLFQYSETKPYCDHCYCIPLMVKDRPHEKCCNCGHKRLTVATQTKVASDV